MAKQEQRQTQIKKTRLNTDLISVYVGKDIVFEIEHSPTNASSGHLTAYDGRFLKITNYKYHCPTASESINKEETLKRNPMCDIRNPRSVIYSLPTCLINVNLIASIKTLDDILEAIEKCN